MVPASARVLQALSPAQVSGTLTAMFGAIPASSRPSAIIASASSAVTSAETGPGTMPQISAVTSRKSRPDFMMREGFVVTPSTIPVSASDRISSISAVSMKNFMALPCPCPFGRDPTPPTRARPSPGRGT